MTKPIDFGGGGARPLGGVAVLLFLLTAPAGWATTLSVRIEDETGAATPARVYLTDAQGLSYFAPHAIQHDKAHGGFSERHFVPPDGAFAIDLAPGTYRLQIERGKEYLPVDQRVEVPSSGTLTKVLCLRRWIRMADRGWYSGDMHVHAKLRELGPLMKAEDLNLALPMTLWHMETDDVQRDTDLPEFLQKADDSGSVPLGPDGSVANDPAPR